MRVAGEEGMARSSDGKLPPRQRGEGWAGRAALGLGAWARDVAVVGRGRVGADQWAQHARGECLVENVVGGRAGVCRLGERVGGVVRAVNEVQCADGACSTSECGSSDRGEGSIPHVPPPNVHCYRAIGPGKSGRQR